jgi:D-alanyl-lipoteichoic acid acyltransferase DltB (MBOAT superfamily)
VSGLGFNLAVLGFFKYFNFFAENLQAVLALAGWRTDGFTLTVLLPVGISFYTFVAMSYVIDVYRRQVEPARSLLDVAVFIGFFPTLLAGPIARASVLLRQIRSPRVPARAQVTEGLWLILWGCFKKMYVADNLAHVADGVFAAGGAPSGLATVLGTIAYAFQIYGDFSGYTDIARGTSLLLGIELNINFRFPYFVRTPQEFWSHWHISLSEWLRDYIFLPVSYALSRRLDGVRWLGRRDDFWIYSGATAVTMLLGGLWHGAAWTFVLWGAYQGLLLVIFRFFMGGRRRHRRGPQLGWTFQWRDLPAVLLMFGLTCYGWLIFRAGSWSQIAGLTGRVFTAFAPSWAALETVGLPILACAGPLLVIHTAEARRGVPNVVLAWPRAARYAVYVAIVYTIVLFGDLQGSEFLYFQF